MIYFRISTQPVNRGKAYANFKNRYLSSSISFCYLRNAELTEGSFPDEGRAAFSSEADTEAAGSRQKNRQ